MAQFLRPALAIVLGFFVGSGVNMALVMLGGKAIPPPAGADATSLDGLRASMHLFEPRHFVFPFLAHGVGTLAGAFAATLVVQGRSAVPGYVVGGLFMIGGIANVFLLPGPAWFSVVDLVFAYFPAAWAGIALARRLQPARGAAA